MPTYQYHCDHCEKEIEVFQKITADPLKTCPECGQESLRRGIGGGSATLRFQGGGFYINDYGPNKDNNKEPTPSSPCACGKPASCSN